MSRTAIALIALLVTVGCNGGDATGPASPDMRPDLRESEHESSSRSKTVDISYEKWFTTPPGAMTGNTGYGPGTFSGTLLKRVPQPDGTNVLLEAIYTITDSRKGHSFTAHIEGLSNLPTKHAVLDGVVTDGWRRGAPVHVEFDVLTPCPISTVPVVATCYRGTISVAKRGER